MEAYLNDKDALLNPEEVSLEWTDEQIATIFQDTWGAIDAPAEDDASLEGVLKKSVSGALEGIRVTAGTVSKLNLLTYGPVPNLSSITGGATLASGLIGVGQKGYEAYSAFKEGKAAEGMESVIKTTAAGAEVVTGIAALGAGSAMMGPIACAVAAGTNLLINFKDLFLWASEDKELPENFWWNFMSNLAMFIGPVLLLAGVLSNPYVALGVLLGLAILAMTGFIMANKDALQEMLSKMDWWEKILFAAPIVISISLTAAGVPNAMWIGLGVSVGAALLNLLGKKFLKDPAPPAPVQEEEDQVLIDSEINFSDVETASGSDSESETA
jgi:hypothetical protein